MMPKDLPEPGEPKTAIESGRFCCPWLAVFPHQVADAAEALDLLAVNGQQVAELPQRNTLQGCFRSFADDLLRRPGPASPGSDPPGWSRNLASAVSRLFLAGLGDKAQRVLHLDHGESGFVLSQR